MKPVQKAEIETGLTKREVVWYLFGKGLGLSLVGDIVKLNVVHNDVLSRLGDLWLARLGRLSVYGELGEERPRVRQGVGAPNIPWLRCECKSWVEPLRMRA